MKLLKLLILSSLILAGCHSTPKPSLIVIPAEPPTVQKRVVIDPEILKECGNLVDNIPKGSTFEDILIVKGTDAQSYAICKKYNQSKNRIIKEYLLNETPSK